MWGMAVNFLSNMAPRNLYWSIKGISVSSSLMEKLLCIFLKEQKCTHWVLDFENLKPLSFAHLFYSGSIAIVILMWMWVDLYQRTKRAQSIVGFRHLAILLIFMEKRVMDRMLPCGMLSFWFAGQKEWSS